VAQRSGRDGSALNQSTQLDRMRFFPGLALVALLQSVFAQQFLSVDVNPAPLIEWDQQPFTFYTGQTINVTWTSQGFAAADQARITYPGVGGTRTLTSGTLIQPGFFANRLSDSANGVANNVSLTVAFTTTTSIAKTSTQGITVIQSKLMNVVPQDGSRILGGGQNTVCDDRNLTVSWRGLGEAQFGTASIQLRRQSGFTGTTTLLSVSSVPVSGNTTVFLVCPRTATPSSSNSYAFQLTVTEPGGADYTATSPSFLVATAPTPSPTGTSTPTPSKTPTPSPSSTPSPTSSVSVSRTPTPSQTPTVSPTPSTSETARPSIDYIAIGRAAADQVDTTTPAVAGALGGIGGILILLGAGKWYHTKVLTERRKKKQAMTTRFVQDANRVYGITETEIQNPVAEPGVVMYTVQGFSQQRGLATYKKSFPPNVATK